MIDGPVVTLSLSNEFEPHGRASETWEPIWLLKLERVPFYWKSTTGWRLGTSGLPMYFKGRDGEAVVREAIDFLDWHNEANVSA